MAPGDVSSNLPDSGPASAISSDTVPHARILVVVPLLAIGGAERHIASVFPRLAARGFDIRIVTARPEAVLDQALRDARVPVFNTRDRRPSPIRRIATCLNIWRQIRDWQPDVVHFFLPEAYILGGVTAWLSRSPVRVMSRRSLNNYQAERPWVRRAERFLHKRMTAIVANSEAVQRDLLDEGVPSSRLHLIRNGVSDAMFTPPPRSEARASLDISDDAFVMTCVANLIPYKGHADLIDALGSCRNELPEGWQLLLAGRDDGIRTRLEERAMRAHISANIRFLGGASHIPDVLGASDLGLLCSHEEGSPNSVLESMAAGLAMVVTNAGGTAEAVVDGQTGLVAQPRNPMSIAQAIQSLAWDAAKRAEMGRAGQARARELHSLEVCTNAYARLYEQLLGADDRTP